MCVNRIGFRKYVLLHLLLTNMLVAKTRTCISLIISFFFYYSWPVRDSACVASGFFVEAFPDECKSSADEIADNFYHNLTDNIPSVREGAAVAMKKFCSVYPDWVEGVMEEMKKGLGQVANQEENSILNDGLEKGAFFILMTSILKNSS